MSWTSILNFSAKAVTAGRLPPLGILSVLLYSTACTQSVPVSKVIAEGEANELVAVAKYEGSNVRVHGVIGELGIHKKKIARAKHSSGFGKNESVVTEEVLSIPFVHLRDDDANAKGQIACYFNPTRVKRVAELRVGERLVVDGKFQRYESRKGELWMILEKCLLRGTPD